MPSNSWTPGKKKSKNGKRRVPNISREEGVREICKMLAAYTWSDDLYDHYCDAWNISRGTLVNWVMESARRLRSSFTDDELRTWCVDKLANYAALAEAGNDIRTAITAIDKVATVSGLVRRNEMLTVNVQLNPVEQISKALSELSLTQDELAYVASTGQLPPRVALVTEGQETKK